MVIIHDFVVVVVCFSSNVRGRDNLGEGGGG